MSQTRKLAAILVADVVGCSRLAGSDEDRTIARLPIADHHGRIVKRTKSGPFPVAGQLNKSRTQNRRKHS